MLGGSERMLMVDRLCCARVLYSSYGQGYVEVWLCMEQLFIVIEPWTKWLFKSITWRSERLTGPSCGNGVWWGRWVAVSASRGGDDTELLGPPLEVWAVCSGLEEYMWVGRVARASPDYGYQSVGRFLYATSISVIGTPGGCQYEYRGVLLMTSLFPRRKALTG